MSWSRKYDGAEPQRVNKWLAQAGVCSRREAEALIEAGHVYIEGKRVEDVGRKIAPGETLTLNDRAAAELTAQVSVVINKPAGIVSAQPEGDQIPAARLLKRETLFGKALTIPGSKVSLAPMGRLDQDSRGLLVLSEDGVLAKAVIGPESQVDKEYVVTVKGRIDRAKINLLRHGLELDGRKLKPAKVKLDDTQVLRFTLTEGRNRQIRRMCELVELEVTDLVRVRIGPLHLGDLPEGKWRPLTAEERSALIAASTGSA
ncbi:MAG TPA: pseudouridine synthase [Hyphomonadaceae bacterium]|nr:pseudouridine synthase [Hyphomonadaceae bacterium]